LVHLFAFIFIMKHLLSLENLLEGVFFEDIPRTQLFL